MVTLSTPYPLRRLRRLVKRLLRRLGLAAVARQPMRIDRFTDELDSILKGGLR